jgi:hypothetical protein
MSLTQMHHEFKDGHTEFMAQRKIESNDELREWAHEVNKRHPLPEGAQWLFCEEDSFHFVTTTKEEVTDATDNSKP